MKKYHFPAETERLYLPTRLSILVLGLGFLGACSPRDEKPDARGDENSQASQSIVSGDVEEEDIRTVLLKRGEAGEPLTDAERSRFEALILEDPAEAWRLIEGIQNAEERQMQGTLFFKTLANHDPELATQFLPDPAQCSFDERVDWNSAICTAAVAKGNLELSLKLLKENFPGGGRNLVMAKIFPELFNSGIEISTVIEFWNLIDPGKEKDITAPTFAELLVARDPLAAVEWYSKIEHPMEKRRALRGMPAGTPAEIFNQIQATEDTKLRSYLPQFLGSMLAQQKGDIKGYLSKVPEDLVDSVEFAYVQELGSPMGSNPDIKLVGEYVKLIEEYAKVAVTEEARDKVRFMAAGAEFSSNPKAALEKVRDHELVARSPHQWESMLEQWLRLDSIRASEYIAELKGDGVYQLSVQTMVKYLKNVGNDEEAKVWEVHLQGKSTED